MKFKKDNVSVLIRTNYDYKYYCYCNIHLKSYID